MSTITVRELKTKSARQWLKSASKGGLIVMDDNQPVAILLRTDAESVQPTLSALRRIRALRARVGRLANASFGSDRELEMRLLEGLDSGEATPMTPDRRRRLYSAIKKA